VSGDIDCRVFQDQMDRLGEGTLPDEGIRQLRLHAETCPDCAMLLRVHEHLLEPSPGDLEAAVPDHHVGGMWADVERRIERGGSGLTRPRTSGSRQRVTVPVLAAACVLLFVGTLFLFGEVRSLKDREQVLTLKLAELDLRTSSAGVSHTSDTSGLARWERMLSRRESVTLADIENRLAGVPASVSVLDARSTEVLLRRLLALTPPGQPRRGEVMDAIRSEDGLQAGEARWLIAALDVNPEVPIPTDRILAWSRNLNPSADL